MRVFIGDLRYDFSGVLANDCMPLGVAYMKAVMDRDLPEVRSRLREKNDRFRRFKLGEEQALLSAIAPPPLQ